MRSRAAAALSLLVFLVAGVWVAGVNDGPGQRRGATLPAYDRARFGTSWADTDRDGCDTRAEVLERDLVAEVVRDDAHGGCLVLSGRYRDPYTGIRGEADASRLDIDHVVSLGDAWRSGAWRWSDGQRETFANDMSNLLAVNDTENRRKSDLGPADWQPPARSAWCRYARIYTATKARYDLATTAGDRAALDKDLGTCR